MDNNNVGRIACLMLLTAMMLPTACKKERRPVTLEAPVAADDATSTFALAPGFKIELVASEPLIADPVAMEIDENGSLYVVENHGYPLDKTKSSRVKLLRDTDGDGVMDKSTVFADTLLMPTGVMRWKNGILVTDAPHVLYMEDTNGDDKADVIKVLLSGFALSNPQHNVNTPLLGLDNWIYIAHERAVSSEVYKAEFGDTGEAVRFPDNPDAPRLPQNAHGRNVRVRPDTYELEMLASTTQYGHSFDPWGNHFLANNSNHLMHSVISAAYLNRNPEMLVTSGTAWLPDHGNAAEVFPITPTPDRQLLTDVGVMTSACGITYYAGGAFPEAYNTNTTFVAEPVSSIVHADRLTSKGSSFTASRIQQGTEFLASTDRWCRPVNLYTGPDGALYVVDYYREIIEHPEWLSDEVIHSGKLYNGRDMGRIFRISATDAAPATWPRELNLSNATNEALVEKLADGNIWWRRTAQRLLLDRRPSGITDALEQMASRPESPEGRLHALWTLEGLHALRGEHIEAALLDPEPGVRFNAVKLAELHLEAWPSLGEKLIALQDDPDEKVRFQLLCTLGFIDSPEAAQARNKLLFRDITDEFVQVAALSAPSSRAEELLAAVLDRYDKDVPAYGTLVQHLTAMVADDPLSPYGYTLLEKATEIDPEQQVTWQVPVLKGIARGYSRHTGLLSDRAQDALFRSFFDHPARPIRQASLEVLQATKLAGSRRVDAAMARARKIASHTGESEWERALSIQFLALQNPVAHKDFLQQLILSGEAIPIQLAAIRALNAIPDETVATFAMDHWPRLDPAVQDAALSTFLQNETRIKRLLGALESGKVQKASLGWQRSIRLMTQRNVTLRNRARAFFSNDEQIRKVIADYQPALAMKGDVDRGAEVYQKNCALCHTVKGKGGIPFGPDLGTIQSWPASGIMENILNPNQSISHGFDLWNIGLKDGESVQGVITAETPSSLTVRNANGQVSTLARGDIVSQKALNMSAMPEGLERDISHQEMADLLAFLKDGR